MTQPTTIERMTLAEQLVLAYVLYTVQNAQQPFRVPHSCLATSYVPSPEQEQTNLLIKTFGSAWLAMFKSITWHEPNDDDADPEFSVILPVGDQCFELNCSIVISDDGHALKIMFKAYEFDLIDLIAEDRHQALLLFAQDLYWVLRYVEHRELVDSRLASVYYAWWLHHETEQRGEQRNRVYEVCRSIADNQYWDTYVHSIKFYFDALDRAASQHERPRIEAISIRPTGVILTIFGKPALLTISFDPVWGAMLCLTNEEREPHEQSLRWHLFGDLTWQYHLDQLLLAAYRLNLLP